MQFDFLEIILLLGAGQGILLAIAFIFSSNNKRSSSKLLFAFILLIGSWQLIIYALSISGNLVQVPHLTLTNRPFMFLIGPFYYFYVKSLTEERLELKIRDLLHLLPFIFVIWVYKDFYLLSSETKVSLLLEWSTIDKPMTTQSWLYLSANLIAASTYFLATFWLIQDEEKKLFDFISDNKVLGKVSLLKTMTGGFFLYILCFFITLILLYTFKSYTFKIGYSWILTTTLFIHALGFLAVNQPEIFSVTKGISRNGSSLQGVKYQKSGLSNDQAKAYFRKLITLIEEERPYLNSELKLTMLAEELSVSSNLLSQAINQNSVENFYGLINRYRVEHAKKLLRQTECPSNKTILEIALDSGFNTKSSFNRNFKKHTGQTPSSFRESATVNSKS